MVIMSPGCYRCVVTPVQVLWYEFCKSHPNAIHRHSEKKKECAADRNGVAILLCNLFVIMQPLAVLLFQPGRVGAEFH